MGGCVHSSQQGLSSNYSDQSLYKLMVHCPQGHWLAFFQSSKCFMCLKKGAEEKASVCCTTCNYGVCLSCFTKLFSVWEKQVKKLSALQAKNDLQILKGDIEKFINDQNEVKQQRHPHLNQFLEDQHQKCKGMRRGDKKPSFPTSLKVRIGKILKICEDAYRRQTTNKDNKENLEMNG